MFGKFLFAGCALAALTCAAPSFAARTPATDSSYEENYSYAKYAPLFGSNEVYSSSTHLFKQWTDMLTRADAESRDAQHVCSSRNDTACVPAEWQSLIDKMRGLDLRRQVEIANDAMNRHPYVTTMQNWHRSMYWESPFEFLRYGGQCQDYAIAKYMLLRAAGVPTNAMRMVVLRDAALSLDHAVLAVYVDGEPLLLDNLRNTVVPARSVSDYHPYYSINENGWWSHFGGQAMTRVAANYR
ncbi:MAG TPA: transglutaminase-like cysteine peptidase [Stellaceae bacterium]|jgi:predicted transglutaminase-like cysteine proteinase|nr:transglutaminase-like cysteine peptidase [Stellaceae bacterium]